MKLTKKQLDSIKNAKSGSEAFNIYVTLQRKAWVEYQKVELPAYKAYKAIEQPAMEAYQAIKQPAIEKYKKIDRLAYKEYINWRPDYHNMTKAELIKLLEEK